MIPVRVGQEEAAPPGRTSRIRPAGHHAPHERGELARGPVTKTASDTHTPSGRRNTWTGSGVGRINEDYAFLTSLQGCAVLVDGATGLTKANVVAGESDAAWYARTLTERLLVRPCGPQVAMADAVFRGWGAGGRKPSAPFPGATELARIDEPNGSVVALRWQGDQVQVGLLGDCTAVVTMRDGSTPSFHDDTLTKLDDQNYERMYAYATERGTTMAEARKALNPRFIENRLKMNEPGGYWAADVSCRGMAHVLCHAFRLAGSWGFLPASDGYAHAVDMGVVRRAGSWPAAWRPGEGRPWARSLREAEALDAGCWRVHRSKTSDDATYRLIRRALRDVSSHGALVG